MNPWANSIPEAAAADPVRWAEDVGLLVDGHRFDASLCPQAVVPMRAMSLADKVTKIGTNVAPVQSGKSTAGEVVVDYWAKFAHGLIQENWQDDKKAAERWKDRILPSLKSAGLDWAGGHDELVCEARFVKSVLRVQGVFNENALNSDTIPYQLNEEVHLWKPGHLAMARDRQTRIWNSKAFDISNAARVGTQLHIAYQQGTMEEWETFCPVCGIRHAMHFRWNPDKPELGGLRWDASARLEDGRPNYNKLEQTIRYQFSCGHEVMGDAASRRTLRGDYSAPKNEGAHVSHRSWISEAVSYDQISWLDLVREWHGAIMALKTGQEQMEADDSKKPMYKFVTRRECKFYSEESIPYRGQIIVNRMLSKSREGLPGRAMRGWFADKQRGFARQGQLMHYWVVIRDVMANADSQLVYEGMAQTDADLLARLAEHDCIPQSGGVDCTWDRVNVLNFCYQNNCNAQTTSRQDKLFYHADEKTYRIYSKPEGLHKQLKVPPKYDYVTRILGEKLEYMPSAEEPLHWNIHKIGSLKLLNFLRGHQETVTRNGGKDFIKWEVPGDASEEYKRQCESWEFTSRKRAGTGEIIETCRQRYQDDHMLMCEAAIANLIAMAPHPEHPGLSILSVRLAAMGITEVQVTAGAENLTTENAEK